MTDKLVEQALERFRLASEAEKTIRAKALEDQKFLAGEQWPAEILTERNRKKRPCLTINRLPQFVKQVTNEIRQNRPSIKVSPVDDRADIDTAEVLQGIIRHIEVSSDAEISYDTSGSHAVEFGFGAFRVITEYATDDSFDQEIRIDAIPDPFSVYFDPTARKKDRRDAKFCFVISDVSIEDFKSMYPDADMSAFGDSGVVGDKAPGWYDGKSIRIAEYWHVETETVTIALLADNSIVRADQLPPDVQPVRVRKVEKPVVKWCKINAAQVLESGVWPGRYIPIIPVYGDESLIDGERMVHGIVRFALDSQRMYNYWATAETEMIALAPKAPFIGAAGQFEGYEAKWASANVENHAYLEYKPVTVAGSPAGPPQRQIYEPPVNAITTARMQSADDLKATTGIYDASLGARSNEQSGRAILARQKEGDVANFHYADNLNRAIKHLGRILIDLIPHIYDTPRILRIIGRENDERMVPVNQPTGERDEKTGVEKVFDLSVGAYDVTVDVGPSYASKRQEAVEAMLELSRAYPTLMQVAGDLLVKNMDWPGAQEIAERLKKTLPPSIAESDDREGQIPDAARQQMQAMGQQIEQLTQALTEAQEAMRTKRLELESRERIAEFQGRIELVKTFAQADSRESMALLGHEIAAVERGAQELAEPDMAHEQMEAPQQEQMEHAGVMA